jgi:methanethiol S-methyltransferase
MRTSTRIADYSVMALSVILGGGSIALFGWADRPILVPLGLSPGAAAAWNVLVSCLFFLQHSIMVRRSVRARLSVVVPDRYDGAFYSITSGIALAASVLLFQPRGEPLFVLQGIARLAVITLAFLALAGFAWGVLALGGFDPFGLRPIRNHLRGRRSGQAPFPAKDLVVRGPYRWVRHPLYSSIIVLLWADPEMTMSRLAIAAVWTAWIVAGAVLEERDLVADFGDAYRQYQREVPMLVPRRAPARAEADKPEVL